MFRGLVLLTILAAAYCQQCNSVVATETIPTEDLYFERTNSTSDYLSFGFVDPPQGKRDYYSGSNLFYSQYARTTGCFFKEMVKTWKCQLITPANVDNKIEGFDSSNYKGVYVNDESWLCTVPEGLALASIGTSPSFYPNQLIEIGSYGVMLGLVKINNPQDVSREIGLYSKQVKRQAKRYQVTDRTFKQGIYLTNDLILAGLAKTIKKNVDAKIFKAQELPNKMLQKNTFNVLFYTAGAKILLGTQIDANPGVIISYSMDKRVECNQQDLSKASSSTNS